MTDLTRLPSPTLGEWEWQQHGACRTVDTEAFFYPDNERGPTRLAREQAAKAICAGCPVLAACREQALASREPYGIWGGLTEHEREAIVAGGLAHAS